MFMMISKKADIMNDCCSRYSELNQSDRLAGSIKLLESAPFFDVELSALCDANCIFCPRHKLFRKYWKMQEETWLRLIDWFPHDAHVMLAGLGEPFMHPDLVKFIQKLKERRLVVGITTNGFLLNDKMVDLLNQLELDLLQVSFHAATKDKYEQMMPGSDYEQVCKNLTYLSTHREKLFDIKLSITLCEENNSDEHEIEKLAERWGFQVFPRHLHSRAGHLISLHENNLLTRSDSYDSCGIFSKVTFISSSGYILPCCQVMDESEILGDIAQLSFSDLLVKKRKHIESNEWWSLCHSCDDDYRYHLILEALS